MKRYVALIVLMLACLLPVAAQQREEGRPRFNMEEFQGWMKSFIRERACLTQAEADLVFPVFFEMKQKQGQYQRKRSLRLSRAEAQALIAGDQSVLLRGGGDFGAECYAMMQMHLYRPKAIVEYDRFAFIAPENSTRITFDSAIRASETNFDVFDEHLMTVPVMQPSGVVLEVKFNGFLLSYIKDMLLPVQKSELSVSKYCMARQVGCNYLL